MTNHKHNIFFILFFLFFWGITSCGIAQPNVLDTCLRIHSVTKSISNKNFPVEQNPVIIKKQKFLIIKVQKNLFDLAEKFILVKNRDFFSTKSDNYSDSYSFRRYTNLNDRAPPKFHS